MNTLLRLATLALFTLVLSLNANAKKYSTEDFFSHAKYNSVQISPDGKHIAVTYREDTEVKMAILNRKTKQVTAGFSYGKYRRIMGVKWLNNQRVGYYVHKFVGYLDTKGGPGMIFAANIDGSKRINLTEKIGPFTIVSMMTDDPRRVLIAKGRREGGHTKAKLQSLDIYRATMKFVSDVPRDPVHQVFADVQGAPRAAIFFGQKNKDTIEIQLKLYFKNASNNWEQLNLASAVKNPKFNVVGFSADRQNFYFTSDYDDAKKRLLSLYKFNITTKKATLIKRHDFVDILSQGRVAPDGTLLSVAYDDGFKRWLNLSPNHWTSRLYSTFEASFVDSNITMTSFTADHNEAVIYVSADNNPGEFYIYNRANNKLSFFAATKPAINKKDMALMNPFTMQARDGVTLHGYLTLPKNQAKNLPMIVMVHGGPHGPRDRWGWSNEAQFLAHNGYAVVQINFRGSGGYGDVFEKSGYKKWGREMQDDITDATLWAVKQGIANKDKICIFGGSYGGYAAAMGVVREPDLYQCAVPYVGVYDLPIMKTAGDIPTSRGGRAFLKAALGEDIQDLKDRSPSYGVSNIKAKLFIAHGKDDVRCPMEQYEALTASLDKAGITYQSMVRDEGHGYMIEQNRYDFYNAMLLFFDHNLKQ